MTSLFFLAPLFLGASALYLFVVAWSFRASEQRSFSTSWLLLPLSGALLAGVILSLRVPGLSASPVSLRLLELLAHLCNILLIWTIVGKLAPAYRLAGTLLYAWNPLVLLELAVYTNTAGVVTCLLLLAVALLLVDAPSSFLTRIAPTEDEDGEARRRPQGAGKIVQPNPRPYEITALMLVGLAMRINLMTLLLAPLLLWFMVRHRRGFGAALPGFAWRALVVLGVFVVAYLPDWRGSETFLAITNGLRLFDFANSPLSLVVGPVRSLFTFVAQRAHFPSLMQPTTAADMTVMATSFFLFALLYLREMGRVRARRIGLLTQESSRASRVIEGEEDTRAAQAPLPILSTSPAPTEAYVTKPGRGGGGREGWWGRLRRPRLLSTSDDPYAYETLFTGWAVVIVGYIVLAATVFLPGYIVWGVWVVALRRFDTLSVCVLLLSCGALLYYPLQGFAAALTGFLVPPGVFGVPLVYLLVQYCLPAGRMERQKVLK